MDKNPPEHDDDAFRLVEQYDSLEDPHLRSAFLDHIGTTRSYINALRLRRDGARKAAKTAPEPDSAGSKPADLSGNRGPKRRARRLPRRSRVVVTRPPNNAGGSLRRSRRNRERPTAVVIIIFRIF